LETIREVAKKFRGKPFTFIWSQGGDQYDFEVLFGAEGSGYPSVIAVHHGKKLFSKMKKAFDEEHLEAFVNDILEGKGKFATYTKEPNNLKTIEEQKEGCDEHQCSGPSGLEVEEDDHHHNHEHDHDHHDHDHDH